MRSTPGAASCAAIFGVEGDEAVHCIADLPYTVLAHAVHIHPTVSELLPTVAGSMEVIEPPNM